MIKEKKCTPMIKESTLITRIHINDECIVWHVSCNIWWVTTHSCLTFLMMTNSCVTFLIHTQLSRKCVAQMYRMTWCMQYVMIDDAFICDIPHSYLDLSTHSCHVNVSYICIVWHVSWNKKWVTTHSCVTFLMTTNSCVTFLIHTQLSRKCVAHMYRMTCFMQHVMSDDAFMCDIPHDYEFMCEIPHSHPIITWMCLTYVSYDMFPATRDEWRRIYMWHSTYTFVTWRYSYVSCHIVHAASDEWRRIHVWHSSWLRILFDIPHSHPIVT